MAINLVATLKLRDLMTAKLRKATKEMEKFERAMSRASGSIGRLDHAMSRFNSQASGINRVGNSFSAVNSRITIVNNNLTQLNHNAHNAGNSLNHIGSSGSSAMSGLTGKIAAAAAALGTVAAGYGLIKKAMVEAATTEMNVMSLEALYKGDTKGAAENMKFLTGMAKESLFGMEEFITTSKMMKPVFRDNNKELEYSVKIAERLAASNPAQKMEGAAFALREALADDFVSLKERFNLSKKDLKPMKEAATQMQKLQALDKLLANQGYTTDYIDKVNKSAMGKWMKLQDTMQMAFAEMGMGALEAAKPALDELQKFLDGGQFAAFKKQASGALSGMFTGIAKGLSWLLKASAGFDSFKAKVMSLIPPEFIANIKLNLGAIQALVGTVVNTVGQHFDKLKAGYNGVGAALDAGGKVIRSVLNALGVAFQAIWPTIADIVATVGPIIWNVITKISNVIAALINGVVIPLLPVLGRIINEVWQTVKPALGPMNDLFNTVADTVMALINEVVVPLVPLIAHELENAWKRTKPILEFMVVHFDNATEAINTVVSAVKDLINWISQIKMPDFGKMSQQISDTMTNGVVNTFEWVTGKKGKSASAGLDNVPYDGFAATLHKGERVLTNEENTQLKKSGGLGGGGVTIAKLADQIIVREEADIEKIAKSLAKNIALRAGGPAW
ncbi:hypothetical protein CEF21_15000 [Bacillus sp. FJAT-42376]|uniref:hypothetical protein n=1 Tax=Bacillus sp. FJAT-42376 TaxID=2014076 RepID=UPI000F4E9FB1|nr:hypothetical protein [Bacillus sp. FJAT-42376]AZB43503.1 hypothetical protein CEF21_15000 [Bacillus sp. FJAT-42376]